MQASGLKTLTIADEWRTEDDLILEAWAWWASEIAADRSLVAYANQSLQLSRDAVVSSWHRLCYVFNLHVRRDRIVKFWMNPLIEMSPFKSDLVEELVKVAALRSLLANGTYDQVKYVGRNKAVAQVISSLCDELNLQFDRGAKNSRSGRRHKRRFPRTLAFAYLCHFVATRWPLRSKAQGFSGDLLMISYFAHLDWELLEKGVFKSFQWSELRNSVLNSTKVDWLHHYISTTGVVSPGSARKLVDKLNSDLDQHTFLDSSLSLRIVLEASLKVLRNSLSRQRMENLRVTMSQNGLLPEWYAVRRHCRDGLFGVAYCRNLLTDILIRNYVASRSKDVPALLLWENQPWERSFCHHLHEKALTRILAYSHTTIPYWCLPYFDDFLSQLDPAEFASVSPDLFLVNGRLSYDALLKAGQPAVRFTEVEAFRYLELSQVVKRKRKSVATASLILVVGEIRQEQSMKLLSALVAAIRHSEGKFKFVFKPHPASDFRLPRQFLQHGSEDLRPIVEILGICDAVVGCAGTSAVVEALAAGVPCASFVHQGELNLSSLLGFGNHSFVSNEEEIGKFLSTLVSSETEEVQDLFFLDAELPRWTSALKATGVIANS